tara:strand:+ start:4074 stop:4451 length:378 start_codon:yes stop_codon:yes gene_type:complete
MAAHGSPKTVVLDEKESINPIKEILYGYPENPIEWPRMGRVDLPANYYNIKDDLLKNHLKNNVLTIPGGYFADHVRTNMIKGTPSITACNEAGIFSRCIYKEIVIVRENGEKKHYSKWVTIIINF